MNPRKKSIMIFKSAIIVVGVVAVAFTGVLGASSFSTSASNSEMNGSFEVVPTGLVGVNIGDEAPNIIMNNPKGKELKLSDLRGSIVLIDFWAYAPLMYLGGRCIWGSLLYLIKCILFACQHDWHTS